MGRMNKIILRGSKLSLGKHLEVHKIIALNRAPKILYKVMAPYFFLSAVIGATIGYFI